MRRALAVVLLLPLQDQDPRRLAEELRDPTEEAVEQAEVFLGGLADAMRVFAFDSVRGGYAEGFGGEPFFCPLTGGVSSRDLGMGVTETTAAEKGRKSLGLAALAANLERLASIEDVGFKLPSASWEEPRLRARLRATLAGREASGAAVLWQDEYDASLRFDGARWWIATCDRVFARRQRAERPAFAETDAGVSLPMQETDAFPVYNEPYASLGGVAAGDFDGDGDDDLYYPAIGGAHLFRNDGGRFTEATKEAGISNAGAGACALWIDFDNDGDLDLLAVNHATSKIQAGGRLADNPDRSLRLWKNDGGRFTDATDAAKLASKGPATSACAADVDNDGDLDVYVAMYADIVNEEHLVLGMMPRSILDARDGAPNQLWRNNGDGTFTEAAEAAGVADRGRGFACAFCDFDGDGDQDLALANDFGGSRIFRNRGDGTFEDATAALKAEDRGFGMGVAWGDADGDGRADLYIANMYSTAGNRVLGRSEGKIPEDLRQKLLKLARGNTLLMNRGAAFEDAAAKGGAGKAGWSWGCVFADFDLDGLADLYVNSGYITGTTRADL